MISDKLYCMLVKILITSRQADIYSFTTERDEEKHERGENCLQINWRQRQ